jgi:hypothetical protein
MSLRVVLAGFSAALLLAGPAWAGHHRWDISEVFSNADGTVQFVELFSAFDGEAGLGPFTLTSNSTVFNFVTNLPSASTANTWALCATAGFAALPGAPTPDYVIPDNFVNTAGDTLNYAGVDIVVLGALPTDGVTSVDDSGTPGQNSPTNFAGTTGSVNATLAIDILPAWGIVALVGMALLFASGLLRRQTA